ncbi:MAG: hypothetical protein E7158_04295 [Firmicutes bacterium]|nr:hypothetical protein [Bacillota bacterium]
MLDVKKILLILAIPLIFLCIFIHKSIVNKGDNLLKKYNIVVNSEYDNHVVKTHKELIKGKKEKVITVYYYNNEYDFNGYYRLFAESYLKDERIQVLHEVSFYNKLEDLENGIDKLEQKYNK